MHGENVGLSEGPWQIVAKEPHGGREADEAQAHKEDLYWDRGNGKGGRRGGRLASGDRTVRIEGKRH